MEKNCNLLNFYSFLGKNWTITIFHTMIDNKLTFNQINNLLNNEINPTLLSNRLKEFCELKILNIDQIKNKKYYYISDYGNELKDLLKKCKKWAYKGNIILPDSCKYYNKNEFLCSKY